MSDENTNKHFQQQILELNEQLERQHSQILQLAEKLEIKKDEQPN